MSSCKSTFICIYFIVGGLSLVWVFYGRFEAGLGVMSPRLQGGMFARSIINRPVSFLLASSIFGLCILFSYCLLVDSFHMPAQTGPDIPSLVDHDAIAIATALEVDMAGGGGDGHGKYLIFLWDGFGYRSTSEAVTDAVIPLLIHGECW